MYVSVAIDLALDRPFTYSVPAEIAERLRAGQLLRVPFGARSARGFALETTDLKPDFPVKPVTAIEDETPFFTPALLKLVRWIASYTASPLESCLKAAVPSAVLSPNAHPRELLFVAPAVPVAGARVDLTARQRELYENVVRVGGGWMRQLVREFKTTPASLRALGAKGLLVVAPREARRAPLAGRNAIPDEPRTLNPQQARALELIAGASRPVLLHGVTGSGKTEIYLQAIARELAAERGAIVLVPEISLTPQTVRRFAARFGDRVAVLHSGLSDGERYDEWRRIRAGRAQVVIGPRSAVFAPVRNLGLVVVDEEHEPSYKQEETPRYHARDVAVMRAAFEGARVVLGSATPSFESWVNAQAGKYALASVPERAGGCSLPEVRLVDMAEETPPNGAPPVFSRFLLDAVAERLRRHEQVILFLNRRGYSRTCECRVCHHAMGCPDCSVPYVYHAVDDCLRCHVCGSWMRVPAACPECGAREFRFGGLGTQRAEAALAKCFPSARILRMDADSTSRRHSHDDLLSAFRAHRADVLLGTQMIAKGLDFPNVTLVGVLNADAGLNAPDFRAHERAYQLLAQVSGRAGRAEKPGEVFIQTFSPDAAPIRAAARNADAGGFARFAADALADRRAEYLPPYCRLASVLFSSAVEARVQEWAAYYARSFAAWAKARSGVARMEVSEAMPSVLEKADGRYRWRVIVRADSAREIVSAWKWLRAARKVPDEVRIALDVDAYDVS